MKTKFKLVCMLILLGLFGIRITAYISQKFHINFSDIIVDLDDEIL